MKPGRDYIGVGVGALVIDNEGRCFLAQRGPKAGNERGTWEFPGGKVSFGETLAEAVTREFVEEYDMHIEVTELLCVSDHILPDEGEHWVSPTFLARHISGEPRILEPEKCTALGWFPLNKLPEPLSLVTQDDLKMYLQKTRQSANGASESAHQQQTALQPEPPRSDEEIQAVTIGEIVPLTAPIQIVDYDPIWPELFEREAARIRTILGERVLLLEHVGSTSVPGLPAKPLIDILLIVADSADEAAYVADLEAASYMLRIREADWHEHRLLKGPDTNINLHVFSPGCVEIERMLGFRDWLRTHPDDLQLYAQTKRELARRNWRHVQHYADAKTAVVEEIIARARNQGRS